MNLGLPAGISTMMAATAIAAYLMGWAGLALAPAIATSIGVLVGAAAALVIALDRAEVHGAPLWLWALLVGAAMTALLWPTWPTLLPPGGASDLTHHLVLIDVLERTGHLVDGGQEAALGEMGHYTPGFHLLAVIAGSIAGVDADRMAYPLLAMTVALKWGFVGLIAYDAVDATRARVPLAWAAAGLVLFAPRAFSLDGFLQAGFFAQVASELFAVAGWWALARWRLDPRPIWMAVVGLMGATVFLVWPIFAGPLAIAVAAAGLGARLPLRSRVGALGLGVLPMAVVAALHLSQHAAWLRLAGTSGAVPALVPGPLGWLLILLAMIGLAASRRVLSARVTIWFAAGIVVQALTLWLLARARGAATPYMAIKMIYLAIYPLAVLGAIGLSHLIGLSRLPRIATSWAVAAAVLALGLRAATAAPLPPPIVDLDLAAAGRWARANLPPACVDYLVDNAEQAYWLHLAVMGQPRASPRTAAIDGYTANRAIGRWIEGAAVPYSIARHAMLPGEVLRDADVVHAAGAAVVVRRRDARCPSE